MTGCRSCSHRIPETSTGQTKLAEKLEKGLRSGNPRYPHVFVGNQAIFMKNGIQIIVTVLADNCSDDKDSFVLDPTRILRDSSNQYSVGVSFVANQPAGDNNWKLQALI